MPRRLCNWLWLHDTPAYILDGVCHQGCVRPPGHPGPHACDCGVKD